MYRRISYVAVALIATLLFFVAIGYSGWVNCASSILSPDCRKSVVNRTAGGLLLTAGLCIFICAVLLVFSIMYGNRWIEVISAAIASSSAILAIAGCFYYHDHTKIWSPFIASMAMTLSIALAVVLIVDSIRSEFY